MSTLTAPIIDTDQQTIQAVLDAQRAFFATGRTRSIDFRMNQLRKLRDAIKDHEQEIMDALHADLRKPAFEAYGSEIGFALEEIDHTLKNLRQWAKPLSVAGPLTQFLSFGRVQHEPRGQVLNIGPWNYPFQLTIVPLIGALSAGNTMVIKPSEVAAATARVVEKIVRAVFPAEQVAVVQGGISTNQALLEEAWDYIFFTGSPNVGRIVYQAAAKHLTPVTLELGGKSPAIVDSDTHLKYTAKRLVWGKLYNTGQTCIAPDYLLVHSSIKDKLLAAIRDEISHLYGSDPKQSPDYGRIINEKHFHRLCGYLAEGNTYCGGQTDIQERYIAPTVLTDLPADASVLQEEIFGPILPVIAYNDINEAFKFILARPKPLALYIFTNRKSFEEQVLNTIQSGGTCINDTLVHLTSPHLPFGGVGNSGIGNYHGHKSFVIFSHERSVLKRSNLLDPDIRYAPYKGKLGLLKRLMPFPL